MSHVNRPGSNQSAQIVWIAQSIPCGQLHASNQRIKRLSRPKKVRGRLQDNLRIAICKVSFSIAAYLLLSASFGINAAHSQEFRFALVIGISQYEDFNIPQLNYADADAQEIANILHDSESYRRDCIKLLLNRSATQKEIGRALRELNERCGDVQKQEDSTALVFFAGHAVYAGEGGSSAFLKRGKQSREYLVPYDAVWSENTVLPDGTQENRTLITKEWLVDHLTRLRVARVATVIDACHSGIPDFSELMQHYSRLRSTGQSSLPNSKTSAGRGLRQSESELGIHPTSAALVSASSIEGIAFEFDELRHGALSYAILSTIYELGRGAARNTETVDMRKLHASIVEIFQKAQIKGRRLIEYSVPQLHEYSFSEPRVDFARVKPGLKQSAWARKPSDASPTQNTTREIHSNFGTVAITGSAPSDTFIEVNGVSESYRPDSPITLGAMRTHSVVVVVPQWKYRKVYPIYLKSGERQIITLNFTGEMTIESVNDDEGRTPGPPLEIFVDEKLQGLTSQLRLSNLHAGEHAVKVRVEGTESETKVAIRPDSPLTVRYIVKRVGSKRSPTDVPY